MRYKIATTRASLAERPISCRPMMTMRSKEPTPPGRKLTMPAAEAMAKIDRMLKKESSLKK
jgi:hypothetical protein